MESPEAAVSFVILILMAALTVCVVWPKGRRWLDEKLEGLESWIPERPEPPHSAAVGQLIRRERRYQEEIRKLKARYLRYEERQAAESALNEQWAKEVEERLLKDPHGVRELLARLGCKDYRPYAHPLGYSLSPYQRFQSDEDWHYGR